MIAARPKVGPAGWLTVTTGTADGGLIEMYPLHRVLRVDELEELSPGGTVHD